MDRQRRLRYVLAVYLVVLSLAVILSLAGLFFTASPDLRFPDEQLCVGAAVR